MKKATITEAKNNLSALIDGLKGGSPVPPANAGASAVDALIEERREGR
jgi:antitoxin (DNA-binding transcriptional repressor) of toxin-antitoxin stability system